MSALHIDGFGHRRATKIGTCDAGAQVQKKIPWRMVRKPTFFIICSSHCGSVAKECEWLECIKLLCGEAAQCRESQKPVSAVKPKRQFDACYVKPES